MCLCTMVVFDALHCCILFAVSGLWQGSLCPLTFHIRMAFNFANTLLLFVHLGTLLMVSTIDLMKVSRKGLKIVVL